MRRNSAASRGLLARLACSRLVAHGQSLFYVRPGTAGLPRNCPAATESSQGQLVYPAFADQVRGPPGTSPQPATPPRERLVLERAGAPAHAASYHDGTGGNRKQRALLNFQEPWRNQVYPAPAQIGPSPAGADNTCSPRHRPSPQRHADVCGRGRQAAPLPEPGTPGHLGPPRSGVDQLAPLPSYTTAQRPFRGRGGQAQPAQEPGTPGRPPPPGCEVDQLAALPPDTNVPRRPLRAHPPPAAGLGPG
ncbi:basic salivary proline-rich protein 4-like [Prinia subflava]|uniref:basic salivary proline-rich protein 4-like n=1 Tax=Prinia subflava TaxID=208062 RepID=UPI002FE0CBD3